jgi:tetratricopeptide (TPR) repeat protein
MSKKDKELRKKKARERKVAQRKIRERQERQHAERMAELHEVREILLGENEALQEETADLGTEMHPIELERFQRYLWKAAVKAGYDPDHLTDSQENELLVHWQSRRDRLLYEDPVEEAQDIMFAALEEGEDTDGDDWRRIQRIQEALIREALERDPGNIDALTLRAKHAFDQIDDGDATGFRLLRESVRKAREALGPDFFRKYGERLHSRVEAKPFLRALSALAEYYDGEHRFEEAFPALQELIGYLPPDETYFRRMHLDAALCLGRAEEARRALLASPFAGLPVRPWAECLLAFAEGDPSKALEHLDQALAGSPYFPLVLLDLDADEDEADSWTSQDRDRGRQVSLALGRAWRKVPGAREWLRPLYLRFLHRRCSNF